MLREENRIDEAENYIKQALEIDPKSSEALVSMGRIKEKQQKADEAIELYIDATKCSTTNI
jgi:tetratricopeptide (TPR) repeat protein